MTNVDLKKNIVVDTAIQCNLLCKIVIDYISNKKCNIVDADKDVDKDADKDEAKTEKKYIQYEEGSFINYRDTNYEVDKIYFYSPSRHAIDGEKFDLEVNIHHGGNAIIAHSHYHSDKEDISPLRKHFHYHSGSDQQHHGDESKIGIKDNIISCILFNIGDHKASDANIFFSQFVHKLNSSGSEESIKVHSNWNVEQILPKRKSFFLYEHTYTPTLPENNTVIVFDNIVSIEEGIFNLIKSICITPLEVIVEDENYSDLKNAPLFYRNNVEMITDEQYKKSQREQIKDLLSIARLNYMKDDVVSSRSYIDGVKEIFSEVSGTGSLSTFQENESVAIDLAKLWELWGQGVFTEFKLSSIYNLIPTDDIKKKEFFNAIKLDTENYDYLGMFEITYQEELNTIFRTFYDIDTNMDFFNMADYNKEINEYSTYPDLGNKEILKIDNIRKSILYYNKLIKFVGFYDGADIGDFKDLGKKSIDDILRKTDLSGEYLYIGKDYKFKSEEVILTNPQEIVDTNLDKEKIIFQEDYLPYYSDNEVFNVYQLKDIQFIISDKEYDYIPINVDSEQNAKNNNNKILLQVYRFFIYLSGMYSNFDLGNYSDFIMEKNVSFYNVFKVCYYYTNDDGNPIPFDFKIEKAGKEMSTTIDNEECQDWLSNDTHYEGSLWKFWEKSEVFPKIGKSYDELSFRERNHIRNGLIGPLKDQYQKVDISELSEEERKTLFESEEGGEVQNIKWYRHNKCRNPDNLKAAPWCYTKNPRRRWNYCVKPDYTRHYARYILMLVFIFVVIIAVVFVKYLFRYELVSKFIAKITGANFASEAVYTANQVVNNIKQNIKK